MQRSRTARAIEDGSTRRTSEIKPTPPQGVWVSIFGGNELFLKEVYQNGQIDSVSVWSFLLHGNTTVTGQVVDILFDVQGNPIMISVFAGAAIDNVIHIPWTAVTHIRKLNV